MTHTIYIDIETIPTQREDVALEIARKISAPSNYKNEDTIARYIAEATPAKVAETALSGTFGELWCVGYAIGDDPVQCLTRKTLDDPEATLLDGFANVINTLGVVPTWVGHNVTWDLRFLWQRGRVHGVPLSRFTLGIDSKPWEQGVVDTMALWSGFRDRVSLHNLALAFGLAGKDGMDGSQVWPAVQAGRWKEVRDYCIKDVEMTREIHKRLVA